MLFCKPHLNRSVFTDWKFTTFSFKYLIHGLSFSFSFLPQFRGIFSSIDTKNHMQNASMTSVNKYKRKERERKCVPFFTFKRNPGTKGLLFLFSLACAITSVEK